MTLHSYHNRPYRKERRRAWPRILGFLASVIPFCILVGLWLVASGEYVR